MRDIKESKDLWTGWALWHAAPLVGLPFAAASAWFGYRVLGIHNYSWLVFFTGMVTIVGSAALLYFLYDLSERKTETRR